jgi:hypothetical protein
MRARKSKFLSILIAKKVMKNETNNTTRMGTVIALIAIAALCLPQQVRAGGSFYPTVTNVTQLIADINYANTAGGTFTINLLPNTNFKLNTGNPGDGFGADALPVIGASNAVNLTILGNGDTLQPEAADSGMRLFEVAYGSSLTLAQATLQNGYSDAFNGGAIYNFGTLTISNCTLSGNISWYSGYNSTLLGGKGGAIYNNAGTVIISDSFLTGNQVLNGQGGGIGGAIVNQSGTVKISNSSISGNVADVGGGIYNDGTLAISNSSIGGNWAFDSGGIANYGTLTISQSTISSNSANLFDDGEGDTYGGWGGGIGNSGTVTVENSSSITGNSATISGADLYNSATLYLDDNSTIGVLNGISAIGLSPALNIAFWSSTAHQLVLSWSTNYMGFTLQSLTGFGSTNWMDCASATVSGASYVVTNSMSAGAQFFRLKR